MQSGWSLFIVTIWYGRKRQLLQHQRLFDFFVNNRLTELYTVSYLTGYVVVFLKMAKQVLQDGKYWNWEYETNPLLSFLESRLVRNIITYNGGVRVPCVLLRDWFKFLSSSCIPNTLKKNSSYNQTLRVLLFLLQYLSSDSWYYCTAMKQWQYVLEARSF